MWTKIPNNNRLWVVASKYIDKTAKKINAKGAMVHILSSHDSVLDLKSENDSKLNDQANKGLDSNVRFDGTVANTERIIKLISKDLPDYHLSCCL